MIFLAHQLGHTVDDDGGGGGPVAATYYARRRNTMRLYPYVGVLLWLIM